MKYGNEMESTARMCVPQDLSAAGPRESVTEVMLSTSELGKAVEAMANRIDRNLFGQEPEKCCEGENVRNPDCFERLLQEHRRDLQRTARILEKICVQFGM